MSHPGSHISTPSSTSDDDQPMLDLSSLQYHPNPNFQYSQPPLAQYPQPHSHSYPSSSYPSTSNYPQPNLPYSDDHSSKRQRISEHPNSRSISPPSNDEATSSRGRPSSRVKSGNPPNQPRRTGYRPILPAPAKREPSSDSSAGLSAYSPRGSTSSITNSPSHSSRDVSHHHSRGGSSSSNAPFKHAPTELPPRMYPGGVSAQSPFKPEKLEGTIPASMMDTVRLHTHATRSCPHHFISFPVSKPASTVWRMPLLAMRMNALARPCKIPELQVSTLTTSSNTLGRSPTLLSFLVSSHGRSFSYYTFSYWTIPYLIAIYIAWTISRTMDY